MVNLILEACVRYPLYYTVDSLVWDFTPITEGYLAGDLYEPRNGFCSEMNG